MRNSSIDSRALDSQHQTNDLPDDISRVLDLVSAKEHVAKHLLLANSRCQLPIARSRQLAMYLAHVVFGETMTSVGQAFGRDRTTVSYACGLIEDMRDDPAYDDEICALEAALQSGAH